MRKERCPNCKSKRIKVQGTNKKCLTCKYKWKEKRKRKTVKKDRIRF